MRRISFGVQTSFFIMRLMATCTMAVTSCLRLLMAHKAHFLAVASVYEGRFDDFKVAYMIQDRTNVFSHYTFSSHVYTHTAEGIERGIAYSRGTVWLPSYLSGYKLQMDFYFSVSVSYNMILEIHLAPLRERNLIKADICSCMMRMPLRLYISSVRTTMYRKLEKSRLMDITLTIGYPIIAYT